MHTRRFAILEHTTDQGVHHDLLIEDPDAAWQADDAVDPDDARTLWAARIDPPPGAWLAARQLKLTPLPHHRARYLAYEGPLSAGRGRVRRLAAGRAGVLNWTPEERRLRLPLAGRRVEIAIHEAAPGQPVLATVTAASG